MKFDDYSFDHYQDMWTNATSSLYTYPPFRLSTYSELLNNNWLLKLRNFLFVLFSQLSLLSTHPDKAQMNNHQTSYLTNLYLILIFLKCSEMFVNQG